ncbi:MAG TPA: ubiquinone/menaquinone biosynthesis methyltransferase [Vicinamibacterales bacterium]|nr:ubiquinone/menaquinone biosynthesis methyltransferase [Vicinamibacterales bacterium]
MHPVLRLSGRSGHLVSLNDQIATPEGKSRFVRSLFATIADRYDLITVVLSYGQDRRWKKRLVALAPPLVGCRALDLATGTGDIAFSLASSGARVVGLDITPRMIELAARKAATQAPCGFVVGDMLALPFPDRAFDLVTTGYGLRNVPNLGVAIDEIARVLAPGGVALSLDFNKPANRFVCGVYLLYLTIVGALLGWMLHGDSDTYRYIPASIRRYPGAEAVARTLAARGFRDVRSVPVLGGLMAIHYARRAPSRTDCRV